MPGQTEISIVWGQKSLLIEHFHKSAYNVIFFGTIVQDIKLTKPLVTSLNKSCFKIGCFPLLTTMLSNCRDLRISF